MLDVSILGRLGEGLRLEAKSARGGLPKSMWETYSAFANTEGGTIVLGVEETPAGGLDPVGVERPERLVGDIWNAVNNPARVSANVLTSGGVRVERAVSAAGDEVSVVVVEVPRADRLLRPVFVGGQPAHGHVPEERRGRLSLQARRVPGDGSRRERRPARRRPAPRLHGRRPPVHSHGCGTGSCGGAVRTAAGGRRPLRPGG